MEKQLIEILTRLIDLKEYKDKYDKDEHYLQEQPLLWGKAKTLLKACYGKSDSTSEKDLRVCEVNGSFSECPHCKFLSETFCNNGENNDREYWLMTEVFVYLHKSDVCNFKLL